MSKTKIFGIVAVIVIVLIIIGAMSGSPPSETQKPSGKNIEISYFTIATTTISWGESQTYYENPEPRKMFLKFYPTIKNNGYESFSTNQLYWFLEANNIKYSVESWYTTLEDDWELIEVLSGGTYEGTLVFEVPESTSSFIFGYNSFTDYNIIWNSEGHTDVRSPTSNISVEVAELKNMGYNLADCSMTFSQLKTERIAEGGTFEQTFTWSMFLEQIQTVKSNLGFVTISVCESDNILWIHATDTTYYYYKAD